MGPVFFPTLYDLPQSKLCHTLGYDRADRLEQVIQNVNADGGTTITPASPTTETATRLGFGLERRRARTAAGRVRTRRRQSINMTSTTSAASSR